MSLSIFALSLVLIFLVWPAQLPENLGSWQEQTITAVVFVGVPVVGGLIASRLLLQPGMLEIVSPSCSGTGKVRVEPEEEEKTR